MLAISTHLAERVTDGDTGEGDADDEVVALPVDDGEMDGEGVVDGVSETELVMDAVGEVLVEADGDTGDAVTLQVRTRASKFTVSESDKVIKVIPTR